MKTAIIRRLGLFSASFVALGLVAGTSESATSIGAMSGRALWPADQSCFARAGTTWNAVASNCNGLKTYVMNPPIVPGSHTIGVRVWDDTSNGTLSSNARCQAFEINSNGNFSWASAAKFSTPAGGWQTLAMGTRTFGSAHSFHVECDLANAPFQGVGYLAKIDY
jgi:hypothetical protein